MTLTREGPKGAPVPRILEKESRARGRPVDQFRLVLREAADVEEARALGLPTYLLTCELVTMLGCSVTFPPQLLIGRSLGPATVAPWRRILVLREETLLDPRLEDLVGALLHVNPLTARSVLLRNRGTVDPTRLHRVVVTEGLEAPATLVRLQEFVPSIPRSGEPLPEESLRKQDRNAWAEGVLA